ncbi:uncharacterized protein LOC126900557 isoform X2 [Daktulosphaira vitifoliae]|uniref:uncharacterized protein LOC126900557 isoform X2 n=1 Tax=Daktulosphaira vitifoliae TaxID=58002 RepID=UPI0021AA5D93|nr:uncharacterized protein LOC126900557 isoform X2 [Daktulosphaira vitifoliae]
MIKIRLFIYVILNIKCSISLDSIELHCNFSKHLFNYFKYSEKYLFNFKKTISELELTNYGTAVKSHGEIVMIMLDALREMDEKYIAADIMTVNLYLNNVSGSINMIGKDEHGEFNRSKLSQNLLKGYKILHRSIVERLEYFINENCLNIAVQKYFISLTNFTEPIKCSPEVLFKELEKLNSKIIRSMNEYLTLRDMYEEEDNEILKSYCKILKHLAIAFGRKSYYNFNPKNVLFYDFMENRPSLSELEVISGSQSRQYARYNSDKQVFDVLDVVRYAPLNLKNNNNYEIKLFDMFRFIKFDFDSRNVQVFKKILNTATVRPFMIIIRFYVSLVRKFVFLPQFKNEKLKIAMKNKIIEMGQNIVKVIKSFMDMNLFGENFTNYISCHFNKVYELILSFKERNYLFMSKELNSIPKFCYDYLRRNCLIASINKLQKANITEDNINKICHLGAEEVNKIASFVSELKKYKYCFEIANKYIPTGYVDKHTLNMILNHNTPFGKHENTYQPYYFPGVNTDDIKKHDSHSSNDENDEINNDDNKYFDVLNHYNPKYLLDYILY